MVTFCQAFFWQPLLRTLVSVQPALPIKTLKLYWRTNPSSNKVECDAKPKRMTYEKKQEKERPQRVMSWLILLSLSVTGAQKPRFDLHHLRSFFISILMTKPLSVKLKCENVWSTHKCSPSNCTHLSVRTCTGGSKCWMEPAGSLLGNLNILQV